MSENNVLFILPSKEFRDEEYSEPKKVLEDGGCKITVASTAVRILRGRFGLEVTSDFQIEELKHDDYDGIVFVGGPGAQEYFRNAHAHQLATDFFNAGKVVAAICIAPTILANAGLLEGRNSTAYSSETFTLKNKGANVPFKAKPVEISDNIITADGPQAATAFGEAILNALKEKKE